MKIELTPEELKELIYKTPVDVATGVTLKCGNKVISSVENHD